MVTRAAFSLSVARRTDSNLDGISPYCGIASWAQCWLPAVMRFSCNRATAPDLDENIPNTPSTKFRLGSVTKQFHAASILLLQEHGSCVSKTRWEVVPEAPQSWENISLVHLLTHTSGIPDFTSFAEYSTLKLHPSTVRNTMSWFQGRRLDFSPGERWSYSNSGYVVLGLVIENVSSVSYEQFVRDNIFRPLGMIDSGYDSTTVRVPHHALGYAPSPSGPVPASFIDMSIPYAAGGLFSTVERWRGSAGCSAAGCSQRSR